MASRTSLKALSRPLLLSSLTLLGCGGGSKETSASAAADARDAGSEQLEVTINPGAGSGDDERTSDDDGDGVKNFEDNCRDAANPDQADRDDDHWGDACDNCPTVANISQEVVECKAGGPIGSGDGDGDMVADAKDNCALLANFDQLNSDGDLFGDACDNCPTVANDNQANVDDDRLGDACDVDLSNEPLCASGQSVAKPLKPNLYFLFDTSGSMRDEDIRNLNNAVTNALRGPDGIDQSTDDLVNHYNVGMATFPGVFGGTCFLEPQERLALKEGNTSRALTSVLPSDSDGNTPTAAALGGVLNRQLFVLKGESATTRKAAVVLLTDGSPNDCGGQSGTVQQASRFAAIGVPVYVIAYKIKDEELKQATEVATAGSIDRKNPQKPLEASDAAGIEAAFKAIRSQVASCSFAFEAQKDANFERVDVLLRVDGKTTKLSEGENGYRLNVAAETVELTGSACDTFKARTDGSASVELSVACKAGCEPMKEVCDFRDNDCNGNVDEGCSSTPPEVCNGKDDDADGKVDEGCAVDVL